MDGYILSYVNPDTDGVCASLAIEELYRQKRMEEYKTVLAGKLSEETKYVLNKAGVDIDKFIMEMECDKNKPVILVDTHQLSQIPQLSNPERVMEIWDHHPDGDDEKFFNADIYNYKIGAIASKLVEKLWEINGLNRKYSILLGSAIISNTINFTAPSTTEYDKEMFLLTKYYFEFDREYIDGLFWCREEILTTGVQKILMHDLKSFNVNGMKCLIAQLELCYPQEILLNKEVDIEMQKLKIQNRADYFVLNIIDVQKQKSYLLSSDADSKKITEKMFERVFVENKMEFEEILLRKTDLFPRLSKVLSNASK